jgi:hypothetical protein
MAFHGLVGWASAVALQSQRASEAQTQMLAALDRRGKEWGGGPERRRELIWDSTVAQQLFQTERHLFCNAAYQLLEYRRWANRLKFIDETLFVELDKFADDIDVMRDMNEHVVEYFEGKGKRPHDWDDGGGADASSTSGTRIGGRLDWNELGAAAQRLLERLKPLEPFTPEEAAADLRARIDEAAIRGQT